MVQQLALKSIAYQTPDRYINSEIVDAQYSVSLDYTEQNIGIKFRYYFGNETDLTWDKIAMIIAYQASQFSMKLMRKKWGTPLNKVIFTIQDCGDSVVASIQFVFARTMELKKIK